LPNALLKVGRRAGDAGIDLAAGDGIAVEFRALGTNRFQRQKLSREFADRISITRPAHGNWDVAGR